MNNDVGQKPVIQKNQIPECVIRDLARAFLPDIIAFFNTPEGRARYEAWEKEKKAWLAAQEKNN